MDDPRSLSASSQRVNLLFSAQKLRPEAVLGFHHPTDEGLLKLSKTLNI